jgi:hypothetical protein
MFASMVLDYSNKEKACTSAHEYYGHSVTLRVSPLR